MKPIDLIPACSCADALAWAATQTGTPKQAWNNCRRGDWLLWLAENVGVDRTLRVLASCDCAESVIGLVGSESQLACVWSIDAARRFALGETDGDEVLASSAAADADAAYYGTADAAYYDAASSADANAAASRIKKHAECAVLVRAHIPWSVVEKAIEKGKK